ncbi:MAG TPA: hypothetical protein PLE99_06015 [Candidatus Thiothrix moscowensis]|uniref:hypothetical protein n=1 Tax=unclassified Thiothrix TaxID=2636184 RepID=UPI0025DE2262|nr:MULTISPECIES: hypothetical protein [unclassified Thiothrix]HRJ52301.1 hypothetical protein [Candidatus Thiothrix moscowensis]HRJ92616.1 hypothetical protein [Candidatus Thiothrix moscowensis]
MSTVVELRTVQDSLIDDEVKAIYEEVIHTCNRIINHSNIYGFQLMHIPDPNIHQMSRTLDEMVVPIIDRLVVYGDFSPESGLKIVNVRQYVLHIRELTLALANQDKSAFDQVVSVLKKEAMII